MDCNGIEEIILTDYIDGEASPEDVALVESHMEACAACRALYHEALSRAREPLLAARRALAPPEVFTAVMAVVDARGRALREPCPATARRALSRRARWRSVVAGAVAMAALVVIFLAVGEFREGGRVVGVGADGGEENATLSAGISDEAEFLVSLGADDGFADRSGYGWRTTSIEEYFL